MPICIIMGGDAETTFKEFEKIINVEGISINYHDRLQKVFRGAIVGALLLKISVMLVDKKNRTTLQGYPDDERDNDQKSLKGLLINLFVQTLDKDFNFFKKINVEQDEGISIEYDTFSFFEKEKEEVQGVVIEKTLNKASELYDCLMRELKIKGRRMRFYRTFGFLK